MYSFVSDPILSTFVRFTSYWCTCCNLFILIAVLYFFVCKDHIIDLLILLLIGIWVTSLFLAMINFGQLSFGQHTDILLLGLYLRVEQDGRGYAHMYVQLQKVMPNSFPKMAVLISMFNIQQCMRIPVTSHTHQPCCFCLLLFLHISTHTQLVNFDENHAGILTMLKIQNNMQRSNSFKIFSSIHVIVYSLKTEF